ncbi:MAG: hypothetical protein GY772_29170, partial [bacterium]|nr:hypothetical protein [bacterium]
ASVERVEGYRIYNLGESKTITLAGLVALIAKHMGVEPELGHIETQPGDVTRTFADVTRAREELGYAPSVDIDEGIRRFVAWYREARGA